MVALPFELPWKPPEPEDLLEVPAGPHRESPSCPMTVAVRGDGNAEKVRIQIHRLTKKKRGKVFFTLGTDEVH